MYRHFVNLTGKSEQEPYHGLNSKFKVFEESERSV